jgi:two-component system response regulator
MRKHNRGGCILLVDDNLDDIELTKRAFRRSALGNRLITKRDGQEALDYLLGTGKGTGPAPLPDLMLLDLNMPKLDGLEVLRRMRAAERTRSLPVVVLTTSDEQRDIAASYRLGANSYIRKPVDMRDFMEAIQCVEKYWTIRNLPPAQN